MNKKLKTKRKIGHSFKRDAGEKSPFLNLKQDLELVPISRSTIYIMIEAGEFPKPKKLGSRSISWAKEDVNSWIKQKLNS